jgi:hypothetical protein
MRTFVYIIEFLVLAFIVTAFIFISKQSGVTDVEQKQSADSSATIGIDKLNDPEYFNKKFDDSTATDTVMVK